MPTVNTSYVAYQSRGGRRGHHTVGSPVSFHDAPPTSASPGDTVGITAAPSWPVNGASYTFGFWSVTGAAGGAAFQTSPDLTVQVGNGNVTVRAWYLPAGTVGTPGHPGFFVDAFDASVGDFSDDDFVTVIGDAAMTTIANDTGTVTTDAAEELEAFAALMDGVPYASWQIFGPTETTSGRDLDLAKQTSGFAFAFYKPLTSPPPPSFKVPPGDAIWTWVSNGVKVDGGGLTGNGPVPPWNPEMLQLALGIVMASTANAVGGDLRAPAMELAARQIETSAKALSTAIGETALSGQRTAEKLLETLRR